MFPKQQRLSGRAAKYVSRRGRGVSSSSMRIRWAPSRGQIARATVVVPISFDKRAVRRNRIKRQLREILRPLLPRIFPTVNLMVYAGKGSDRRTYQELRDQLIHLLKKARLLTPNG